MEGHSKTKKHLISWVLLLIITIEVVCLHTMKASAAEIEIESPSAVLMEASTGQIIYEKNADEQKMLASVTKIMTILLIFEALESGKIKLEDKVTVSEHAAGMGGSQVYLEAGESQTVKDMLKCIIIASGNDASVAMAEHIAGSEAEFVARMNEKSSQLGMENTHFLNCCGLDDDIVEGHYSSARDIAVMSRELITRFPEISEYSTIWMDTITHVTRRGESDFGLTNTNKLVRTYDGITGLKTGSTSKAKFCLSATASRNGMNLIAVIMAAPTPIVRFKEASMLLDYGFANCSLYVDNHEDFTEQYLPVLKGKEDQVELTVSEIFSHVCLVDESAENITKEVRLPENVTAPIMAGDKIGKIVYSMNSSRQNALETDSLQSKSDSGKTSSVEIGFVDIVAAHSIEKATYLDCLEKTALEFFMGEEK